MLPRHVYSRGVYEAGIKDRNLLEQNRFENRCLLDVRKPLIQALVFVSEALVIDAEQVQDGCLEIAYGNRIVDDVIRKLVCLP